MNKRFVEVATAIAALKAGRFIILVDDEDRENEGDLVIAAELITADKMNFMIKEARGLVCLAMAGEEIDRLGLPMMVRNNSSRYETAFTVSIEAASGVSTGISAADRAHTVKVATDVNSTAASLITPGHIFPLRARDGGVLVRTGQTEGSVDLMRLANMRPSAVICEIMADDGSMRRLAALEEFSALHDIPIVSVRDIIAFRMQNELLVEQMASAALPTKEYGELTVKVFRSLIDGVEHLVLQKGELIADKPTLVRVHSCCVTGDLFGSLRCDCGLQLKVALNKIANEGGILIYMDQEGRGIGLGNKIKAYALQEQGLDTVDANLKLGFAADHRDYGIGSQILHALGVKELRLMTNNPRKIHGIEGFGLNIVERVPIETPVLGNSLRGYLKTKKDKLGHLFGDLTINNIQKET